MNKPERQLRLVQVGCILLVASCIFVRHMGSHESHNAISFGQWLVIVGAIWSAGGGFTLQRRITSAPTRSQRLSGRSTPLTPWRAGNSGRLWGAVSIGTWTPGVY